MRQDQFEKLQNLSEKLTDVVIAEADSDKWPGASIPVDQQDKTIRGDRYWMKKNAVATVALVIRINTLVGVIRRSTIEGGATGAAVTPEEDELDEEIANAEKEAAKLLNRINDPSNKKRFDRKVHGKAEG